MYCPYFFIHLAHSIVIALPRDVHLHPSFGVVDGDLGHLERPRQRPLGAIDQIAADGEAAVDGALIADAERVRDVDAAATRFATWAVRRRDVGCG